MKFEDKVQELYARVKVLYTSHKTEVVTIAVVSFVLGAFIF